VVGRQPTTLQGIYVAGPHTYLGQLLEAAGGVNLAPEGDRAYAPMTKEQIVALNPQVLIDSSLGEAGSNPAVVKAHREVWNQLPMVDAIRLGRIHYIEDPHMTIPGPDIPRTCETLARFLHRQDKP
jgi:iron complex transport system substrate-binding protein